MSIVFNLPGNISLTSSVIHKIRDGYSRPHGFADPIGSIEFVIPQDRSRHGFWALSWFSRQYASAQTLFSIEDVEIAISEDAQRELRGKLVDFEGGKIILREGATESPP